MVGRTMSIARVAAAGLLVLLLVAGTSCTKRTGPSPASSGSTQRLSPAALLDALAANLKGQGYPVEITDAGEVKTEIGVGEGRTQLVWLGPQFSVLDRPYREIYAFGCDFSEKLYSGNITALITNDGTRCFLGGWGVQPLGPEGGDRCVFTATVPATTAVNTISDLMHCAAFEADRLEKLIVDGDRL